MAVPRVTVALPVFNGEQFVAQCIQGVLGQSWGDLQLIVSDNASTDGTADAVLDVIRGDARARYVRHDANIGAASNFNSVVPLVDTELFRWLSVDDVLTPTYVAACIAALDASSGAVLAQSAPALIDADGRPVRMHALRIGDGPRPDRGVRSKGLTSRFPAVRCFGAAVAMTAGSEFYGVIRTDVLRSTRLNGGYYGDDRTLVVELALRGRFASAPAHLWLRRHGSTQAMTAAERDAYHGGAGGSHDFRRDAYVEAVDRHESRRFARAVDRVAVRSGWWIERFLSAPKRPSTRRAARAHR